MEREGRDTLTIIDVLDKMPWTLMNIDLTFLLQGGKIK